MKKDAFNLVAAGCGTGKTYWVIKKLLKQLGDVKPYEVIFVTSRTIIKEQQAKNQNTTKYNPSRNGILYYWNGNFDNEYYLSNFGISLMTYDRIADIIKNGCKEDNELLSNVKVIIFDECHVLFSDTFIDGIDLIKEWIRNSVYAGKRLCIGLTATPRIIEYYKDNWGVKINRLNNEVITMYKAKQMICTNFNTIPYLIGSNTLKGKTIILCISIADCFKLQKSLQNAAVIISPNQKDKKLFTDDMSRIRDYIIEYEKLPPTFMYPTGVKDSDGNEVYEERKLEVLITTSTMREGLNLREESGIRNVISCFTDELHVAQFVGRCRYSVDNLIIANTYVRGDNFRSDGYLAESRRLFGEYFKDKNNIAWFNTVSHLVSHNIYHVHRFVLGSDDTTFINYINEKWLVPVGASKEDVKKRMIHTKEDKEEIRRHAIQCKLFPMHKPSEVSFIGVVKLMSDSLGYDVKTGKAKFYCEDKDCSVRETYKLIISFDEEKVDRERNYKEI